MSSSKKGDWSVERSLLEQTKEHIRHLERCVDEFDTSRISLNRLEVPALCELIQGGVGLLRDIYQFKSAEEAEALIGKEGK